MTRAMLLALLATLLISGASVGFDLADRGVPLEPGIGHDVELHQDTPSVAEELVLPPLDSAVGVAMAVLLAAGLLYLAGRARPRVGHSGGRGPRLRMKSQSMSRGFSRSAAFASGADD